MTTMATVVSDSAVGVRWMGVGRSLAQNGVVAAREATDRALQGRDAALLIVFCTPRHEPRTSRGPCASAPAARYR